MSANPSILVASLGGILSGLTALIAIRERHGMPAADRRAEYEQTRSVLRGAGYDPDAVEAEATEAYEQAVTLSRRASHVPAAGIEIDP